MLSEFKNGTPPALPTSFNMAAWVLQHAVDLGDKPALEVIRAGAKDSLSFSQVESAVRGIGTGLLSDGLKPGDTVLMRLDNTPEFPLCYLACIAVGLIPVPTAAQLTGPEVAKLCSVVNPSTIIASPGVPLPDVPPCKVLMADDLKAMHSLPPADYDMGDPHRLAYIIFTSGTSGVQRAVCHAHRAILARQMMMQGWYGLTQQDRLMHAGAFNWTYTLGTGLMDPWTIGATALIPEPGTSASALPALMSEHRATIFAAAPGVYRQLLKDEQNLTLPELRHGLSAGEKLPNSTRKAWNNATNTKIFEAFGMSECSTFISGAPGYPAPAGSLGRPQPGRHVAILGPDNQPVPMGQEGEICVCRDDPGLMLTYLNAPDDTAMRFSGRWFRTGDSGSMDDTGAITYLGRADDMMNAGGFRVSPIEVESALTQHPDVQECAVVELPVKADVSVIAAFYVAQNDPGEDVLKPWLSDHLAHYKMPRMFIPVSAVPRGANNKILRRKLREDWKASQ
ncbi:class I adenylate-forming enzyme family protein [Halocynthiibacter sp.]|uniref:class I adenylate-forming enzyme family protein n=1 Tax=Halocynthiibacter sp. TaxID=1979210 RepID=UPI003C3A2259